MKKILFLASVLFSLTAFSQRTDTLIKKLDSLSKKKDSTGQQINNTAPQAYNEATDLNVGSFFILLGSDLKQAFTKPFHMKRKDWGTFGKFALGLGALSLADETIQKFALDLRNSNESLQNIGAFITRFGGLYEVYTLSALGAYGFVFKNKKMQTTTLLALQSYITGAALQSVLKFLCGRQRPNAYDPNSSTPEPTFKGPFANSYDAEGNSLNGSFPSGHTTVAFAAATVYALEYKDKPWVPIICYTSASLIGLSRITENKHWLTDVVAGAALGYLTGKLVVNNYHRYAKLKAPKQLKNSVSFSIGYNSGVLTPGLVYKF
jgi:membrane-associated phospholipid phosphatase